LFEHDLFVKPVPTFPDHALASYVLSSLEGSILFSRAEKSTAPIERTAAFVVQTVRAKLPKR